MEKDKNNENIKIELLSRIQPISNYRDEFWLHRSESEKRVSTGMLSLDRKLNGGLADELYIAAAETSTGKSALMMSIAEAIAKDGTDVLYFALEMSPDEFIARAISTISYKHYLQDSRTRKFTAADILYWSYDEKEQIFTKTAPSLYAQYAEEYFSAFGTHLHIITGGISGLTAKEIANMAALWKAHTQKKPVVFIDYLQLIRPDPDDHSQADRKTKTDITVTILKTLASQIGMPVLTISSISREKYNGKIGTASFKESGDTEYTGGVLIGWNWIGVTDTKNTEAIEEEKEACRQRGYRRMSFEILKYRNAERDTAVNLKYYPAYNYFEEERPESALSGSVPAKKKPIIYV